MISRLQRRGRPWSARDRGRPGGSQAPPLLTATVRRRSRRSRLTHPFAPLRVRSARSHHERRPRPPRPPRPPAPAPRPERSVVTREPGSSRNCPSVTTRLARLQPLFATTVSSSTRWPTLTLRCSTVWSSFTTNTYWPSWPVCNRLGRHPPSRARSVVSRSETRATGRATDDGRGCRIARLELDGVGRHVDRVCRRR